MHQATNKPADPFQQLAKKTLEFRMEFFKLVESQGWEMNANDRKYVLYPLEMIQEYLMGVADTKDDGESWFRFEDHGDVRYKSLSAKFEGNDPIADGSELLWKINQLMQDLRTFPVPKTLFGDGFKTLSDCIIDILTGMEQVRCDAHTYNANMNDAVAELSFAGPEDEKEAGDEECELVEAGMGEASELTD